VSGAPGRGEEGGHDEGLTGEEKEGRRPESTTTEDRRDGSGFTGGGTCGGEERVWGLKWVKGHHRGSRVNFIERGGEERHGRAAIAINGHGGVGSTAFKREALD
jgi:hypothetical protein